MKLKRREIDTGPTEDMTWDIAKYYTYARALREENFIKYHLPDWEWWLIEGLPHKLGRLWVWFRGYCIVYDSYDCVKLYKRGKLIGQYDGGLFSPDPDLFE